MAYAEADIPYLWRHISYFARIKAFSFSCSVLVDSTPVCVCVCVSICHISCLLYILLFRLHAIIIRCSNNYVEKATFNIKPSPCACQQSLALTLMTVSRYYPAHTHFELVPKGCATDPSILRENKTNFPYHNYHMYYIMIKWYADTAIFYFSIYHLLLIKESVYFG